MSQSVLHRIVKNTLFSAEIQRKGDVSAGYKNIFVIFAADFNCFIIQTMIIGRENEQKNFSPRLLTSKTSCFTLVETISSVY